MTKSTTNGTTTERTDQGPTKPQIIFHRGDVIEAVSAISHPGGPTVLYAGDRATIVDHPLQEGHHVTLTVAPDWDRESRIKLIWPCQIKVVESEPVDPDIQLVRELRMAHVGIRIDHELYSRSAERITELSGEVEQLRKRLNQ